MALFIFLGLAAVGLGILIWLSTVDGNLSPQQQTLPNTADWLLKTGVGVLIGMLVDRRVRQTPIIDTQPLPQAR